METRGNRKQMGKRMLAVMLATIMLLASSVQVMAATQTITITGENKDGEKVDVFSISGVLEESDEVFIEGVTTYTCSSDFVVTLLADAEFCVAKRLEWQSAINDPESFTFRDEGYNETQQYVLEGMCKQSANGEIMENSEKTTQLIQLAGNKFVGPNEGPDAYIVRAHINGHEGEYKVVIWVDVNYVTSTDGPLAEELIDSGNAAEMQTVPARYTNSTVLVNGTPVEFEAYNINDNNYFKLRDVAMALSETDKSFNIEWNGPYQEIYIYRDYDYVPVGGELVKGDGTDKNAIVSQAAIVEPKNGGFWPEDTVYNINGNNYFKLRYLGEYLEFDVSWDGENNCVIIDTTKPYTAD